jgi:hypothetical protein
VPLSVNRGGARIQPEISARPTFVTGHLAAKPIIPWVTIW